MGTENDYTVDPKGIKDLVTSATAKKQFAMAMPKHLTADRFLRVALTAFTRTPKLLLCTKESLTECLMDCSALGLEPDGRRAHLIPYKNKCTLIIDYKGLVELARRSGEIADIHADVVREADHFSYSFGTNANLTHQPALTDRGEVTAAYSFVKLKDGSTSYEVMNKEEIDKIRKRSQASGSGPWVTDYPEMAKKTVFRRHSKWLPVSAEFRDSVDKDYDVPIDIMRHADVGKPDVEQPKSLSDKPDTPPEDAKPEPEKKPEIKKKKTGAAKIEPVQEPEPEEQIDPKGNIGDDEFFESKEEREKQEIGNDGYFELLQKCRELKGVLGDEIYYKEIEKLGFTKSNEMKVPDLKKFVKALEKLLPKKEREPGAEG